MRMEVPSSSPKRSNGGIVRNVEAAPLKASPSSSKRKLDLIEPDESSSPKGKKERVLSSATRILIIPDKLDEEEMDRLRDLVTQLGGMNSSSAYANVVLTTLRSEKRIVRQLAKDVLVSSVDHDREESPLKLYPPNAGAQSRYFASLLALRQCAREAPAAVRTIQSRTSVTFRRAGQEGFFASAGDGRPCERQSDRGGGRR